MCVRKEKEQDAEKQWGGKDANGDMQDVEVKKI